ncbi:glycosyltransferase family 2 protein [Pseudomonas fluorescens]|uniref:glycosyltransferase family 2 protein n=1 Tax=Pseudomonas fluorescens TaxID=294 RepID=UPI003C24EDB8
MELNFESNEPAVTILMSTYNGEDFLAEQLDSILNQSYTNWELLIRDDGSTDNTMSLISVYSQKDTRIKFIHDCFGNQGSAKSFALLLKHVKNEYFMFSDQDDVWLPEKVAITIQAFTPSKDPQLVFTDLQVVDRNLKVLSNSFMAMSRFDTSVGVTFPKLILQNIVVGCTSAGNKALIDKSGLLTCAPNDALVMHDWWLALTACVFGRLTYVDSQTILYRQHGRNHLGAKRLNLKYYVSLLLNSKPWLKARDYLDRVTTQASSFYALNESHLSSTQKMQIEMLIEARTKSPFLTLIKCFAHKISMHKFDRNFALLISVWGESSREAWKKIDR